MIDLKRLHQIPAFRALTEEELKELAGIAGVRKVKRGELLFKDGDKRETFFVVLKGQVHIFRTFNEEVQTLALLDANEFAVENALLDDPGKHEHTCETFADGELLEITNSAFLGLKKSNPILANRIYAFIIGNLVERLHHANNKIVTIYSTGKIAAAYENLDHLTELLLKTILETIHAKRGIFALFEPLEGKAVIRQAIGYKSNQAIMNLEVPLGSDPILGTLAKAPIDFIISEEQFQSQKGLHTPYASRNMLGVALHIRDKMIGAILLGDKEGAREFSHNNKILLDIIARQIVLPVVTAELAEKRPLG